MGTSQHMRRAFISVLTIVGCIIAVGLVLSVVRCRDSKRYGWKLRNLHLAISAYAAAYGQLPPLVVERGSERLYSWRVLVGPWAEELDTWPSFDRTAAWNSEQNSAFRAAPSAMTFGYESSNLAKFLFVTGPGTAFDQSRHVSMLSELPGDLIYIVEVPTSAAHWMEPKDFDISQLPQGSDISIARALNTEARCFYVVFVDGQVACISTRAPGADVRRCMLRASASRSARDFLIRAYECR